MKKLKVFYNGVYLRDVYPHATKWEVIKYRFARGIRVLGIQAVIALALLTSHYIGQVTVEPVKVYADREVVKEVKADSPVMERIADCESGKRNKNGTAVKDSASHFDSNTGQVFTKANDNKSVDIGRYMVNETYWGKKAYSMGLDLTKESDNKKMAYWIYENRGTVDWMASSNCWNK